MSDVIRDSHIRSLAKALSWRIVGLITTPIIACVVIGPRAHVGLDSLARTLYLGVFLRII